MAVLKGAGIDRFLRSPDMAVKALLVYGADEGRVRELAQAAVAAVAGSLDDPFRVARLSDDQLGDDPALLADEARALSMTGGRRAVWVRQAGGGFQKALELFLAAPAGDALVVAEAGALAKTSKLRQQTEKAAEVAVVACYEDTPDDLRRLASEMARRDGLAFEPDALALLVEQMGADRASSRGEIEKLLLYCHGGRSITAADVQAACGDASGVSIDELVDAVMDGDAAGAVRMFDRLQGEGMPASVLLGQCLSHLVRLRSLRFDVDAGKDREAAVRAARPPVFFQRAGRIARQLGMWDRASLATAASTIQAAVDQTRHFPALEAAIAERAFLVLARKSQSQRSRAA